MYFWKLFKRRTLSSFQDGTATHLAVCITRQMLLEVTLRPRGHSSEHSHPVQRHRSWQFRAPCSSTTATVLVVIRDAFSYSAHNQITLTFKNKPKSTCLRLSRAACPTGLVSSLIPLSRCLEHLCRPFLFVCFLYLCLVSSTRCSALQTRGMLPT